MSELGAYVKISNTKRAHLVCFEKYVHETGFAAGKQAVLDEQKAEQERQAQAKEAEIKRAFEALPRCNKCGTRMATDIAPTWVQYGEVKLASAEAGRCRPCVREEVQARAAAKGQNAPCVRCKTTSDGPRGDHPGTCTTCWNTNAQTASVQEAVKPLEKLDETLKRFSLLEID